MMKIVIKICKLITQYFFILQSKKDKRVDIYLN